MEETGARHTAPHVKANKQTSWLGRIAIGVAITTAGVMSFLIVATVLDTQDPKWVECEVLSAKAEMSGGRALRGSAGSVPRVVVETSNCNTVAVTSSVTKDNMNGIARAFTSGASYEFILGWTSQRYANATWPFLAVTAQDFRIVPQSESDRTSSVDGKAPKVDQ